MTTHLQVLETSIAFLQISRYEIRQHELMFTSPTSIKHPERNRMINQT